MSSSSASSSAYATDEESEEPPSAGSLLLFHMVPETIMTNANAKGKRTDRCSHRRRERSNEMLKEMKNLKRQNVITHCLLGTMIVLTLGWQLSEISLILTLKDGFTHPFRSIAHFLSRTAKRRASCDATKEEDSSASSSSSSSSLIPIEPPPVMKMPELPKFLDISKWGQNGSRE